MYCQKCNRLLDESLICPKCGFDNHENLKKTLTESKSNIKKKPQKFIVLILILCLIIAILLTVLIIYENNNNDTIIDDETPTTATNYNYENTFEYKDLEVQYPDTWGSSTGTIFYKDYAKINITFRDIDSTEYNEIQDLNDCLDSSINEIKTKTYANDTSYSYIFELNSSYYLITVNYTDDNSIFTKDVQNEVSNIIQTLKAK